MENAVNRRLAIMPTLRLCVRFIPLILLLRADNNTNNFHEFKCFISWAKKIKYNFGIKDFGG